MTLFNDVPRNNNVSIRFKGRWKNKFGHIKLLKTKDTEIVVNSLFRNEIVPEGIIDATIAHELVHYAHGSCSPLEKRYKHPHAGGIIRRELCQRGFEYMMKMEKEFVKKQWLDIYKELMR
jgi:hypothetical protein